MPFLALISLLTQGAAPLLLQNGGIVGQIRLNNGGAPAGIRVAAVAAQDIAQATELISITQTDSSGPFRLENIPPGRYYAPRPCGLPTYYPGVRNLNDARIVPVAADAAEKRRSLRSHCGARRQPTLVS